MMTSAESGEDGNSYGYRLPQNQEERLWAFQVALVVKNPPANAGRCKRCGFDPWVEKIPWKRAWQPTPVFLPGESHGQISLAGYSPWGHKESDTTEAT